MKLLSLSPNDLIAAVTVENEALLFIVFATVMARIFVRNLL